MASHVRTFAAGCLLLSTVAVGCHGKIQANQCADGNRERCGDDSPACGLSYN
jgi:hypothetical protein